MTKLYFTLLFVCFLVLAMQFVSNAEKEYQYDGNGGVFIDDSFPKAQAEYETALAS